MPFLWFQNINVISFLTFIQCYPFYRSWGNDGCVKDDNLVLIASKTGRDRSNSFVPWSLFGRTQSHQTLIYLFLRIRRDWWGEEACFVQERDPALWLGFLVRVARSSALWEYNLEGPKMPVLVL